MIALSPLAERLRAEISKCGPISFARFVEHALLDPDEGYYAASRARIGKSGDFYTNVSVGPAFARIIAWQFAEMWHLAGGPQDWNLIEQGANDGQFAHDFLGALAADSPEVFDHTRVVLVEPFSQNRTTQEAHLTPWAGRIEWTESLSDLSGLDGLHFTNEFADALPVHLLVRSGPSWQERGVDIAGDTFAFVDIPLTATELSLGLPEDLPVGAIAEVRPAADAWIHDVSKILHMGWILVADYGLSAAELYAPWRTNGTYTAYREHRRQADVLADPGSQDITAHVNFTALANAGIESGLQISGYADQYHFLIGAAESLLEQFESRPGLARTNHSGAPHLANHLAANGSGLRHRITPDTPRSPGPAGDQSVTQSEAPPCDLSGLAPFTRQFKTLVHPQTMGTHFKFLGLSKAMPAPLNGFKYARPTAPQLGL